MTPGIRRKYRGYFIYRHFRARIYKLGSAWPMGITDLKYFSDADSFDYFPQVCFYYPCIWTPFQSIMYRPRLNYAVCQIHFASGRHLYAVEVLSIAEDLCLMHKLRLRQRYTTQRINVSFILKTDTERGNLIGE
jgi:hypothetical protein